MKFSTAGLSSSTMVAPRKSEPDDAHATEGWHWSQKYALSITSSVAFDGTIIGIIFVNLVFIVYEADVRARGEVPKWHQPVAWVFLFIYTVEVLARLYAQRCRFFMGALNILDTFVVVIDLTCQVLVDSLDDVPSAGICRVLRVARLVKLIRAAENFRELWLMLNGLASAMKAIFWALIIIAVILLIMSVLAVELIRPIYDELAGAGVLRSCDGCEDAFSTVLDSLCTLFLLIFIQDLWTDIALPITKHSPWAGLLLVLAFIIVNVGLLNLILAVIVDRAEVAREEDEEQQLLEKKNEQLVAMRELEELCLNMDVDGTGDLTLDELQKAFKANVEFQRSMSVMDISSDDLETVFRILDEDRSGSISRSEFVDNLFKMKTQHTHTLLVFIKHHSMVIREQLEEHIQLLGETLLQSMARNQNSVRREIDVLIDHEHHVLHELEHMTEREQGVNQEFNDSARTLTNRVLSETAGLKQDCSSVGKHTNGASPVSSAFPIKFQI